MPDKPTKPEGLPEPRDVAREFVNRSNDFASLAESQLTRAGMLAALRWVRKISGEPHWRELNDAIRYLEASDE